MGRQSSNSKTLALTAFFAVVHPSIAACKAYPEPPGLYIDLEIQELTLHLQEFMLTHRCLPRTLNDWLAQDPSARDHHLDPWGHAFVLRWESGRAYVQSMGHDGVFDSSDDSRGAPVEGPTCP